MMKRMMDTKMNHYEDHDSDVVDLFRTVPRRQSMESKFRKSHEYDNEAMSSLWRSMGQMRYKRQADDSLALNDRLKEKLVALMEDSKQYKMPSQWFGDKYEEILEGCYEVSENLPASLQEEYVPSNYNGPLRNLGKIKSFMNCCKSAKMKLCMNQDTKKKIETNFGPVEELVEGFNNQLTEDQVFFMVNQLLEGSEEDQYM